MSAIRTWILFFLTSLLLTAAVFGTVPVYSTASNPTTSVHFNTIEGLIIIQATIDGHSGNYIFDTGAPGLILNKQVDKGEFTLWMIGKELEGKYIGVNKFQFGGQTRYRLKAWAADLSFLENIIQVPLSGIIGGNMFSNNRVFLDYEDKTIHVHSDHQATLNVPVNSYSISTLKFEQSTGNLPIVAITIGDESRRMIFDTGANISVLNEMISSPKLASQNFTRDIKLKHVSIEDMPFISQQISELSELNHQKVDGILSVSSLNSSKVLIDYVSSRIYIMWTK